MDDIEKDSTAHKNVILIVTTLAPRHLGRTHWPYDTFIKPTKISNKALSTNLDFAGNTYPITEKSTVITIPPTETTTDPKKSFSTAPKSRTNAVSTNLDFGTNADDEVAKTTPIPTFELTSIATTPTPAIEYTQTNRFDTRRHTDISENNNSASDTTTSAMVPYTTVGSVNDEEEILTTQAPINSNQADNSHLQPTVPITADPTENTIVQSSSEVNLENGEKGNIDSDDNVAVTTEEKSTTQTPSDTNQADNSDLQPTVPVSVEPTEKPIVQSSSEVNENGNIDSVTIVAVTDGEKLVTQTPIDTNETDNADLQPTVPVSVEPKEQPIVPSSSEVTTEEKLTTQTPISINEDDNPNLQSTVNAEPTEKSIDQNSSEVNKMGNIDSVTIVAVTEDEKLATQTPIDTNQTDNKDLQPTITTENTIEHSSNEVNQENNENEIVNSNDIVAETIDKILTTQTSNEIPQTDDIQSSTIANQEVASILEISFEQNEASNMNVSNPSVDVKQTDNMDLNKQPAVVEEVSNSQISNLTNNSDSSLPPTVSSVVESDSQSSNGIEQEQFTSTSQTPIEMNHIEKSDSEVEHPDITHENETNPVTQTNKANQIENTNDTQSPNEMSDKTNEQTMDKSNDADNSIVNSHPAEEQTSTPSDLHQNNDQNQEHVGNTVLNEKSETVNTIDEDISNKQEIQTVNVLTSTVYITTVSTPSQHNSISNTNELIGDKSTSMENEISQEVNENASSIKLSSINIVMLFLFFVLISYKCNQFI